MDQEIVTKCGFLLPFPSCFKPALLPVISASGVVSSKCPIYCPTLPPPPPSPGALCPTPSVSTRHLSNRVFLLVLCPFLPLSPGTSPSSAWHLARATLMGSTWSLLLVSEVWRASDLPLAPLHCSHLFTLGGHGPWPLLSSCASLLLNQAGLP